MLKFLPWIGVFFAGLTIGLLAGMILATGKGDGKPTATPTTAQASVPPATTEEPVPASTPAPEQPVVGTSPARGAQVGQIAPDFLLKNLAGEEVQLDGTRNRVVVLVFWKIADMDSETMMPHLKRFYQENKDDADLLLVTVNSGSSRNAVKPLADVSGWEFQILLDEDAKQTAEYEVSFWPTTFFLDREGIIRDRVSEVWTFEQLNERANRLK